MAAGVVLFTMVAQGGTLPLVVRWTGLSQPDEPEVADDPAAPGAGAYAALDPRAPG
jgi:hypothetical protein